MKVKSTGVACNNLCPYDDDFSLGIYRSPIFATIGRIHAIFAENAYIFPHFYSHELIAWQYFMHRWRFTWAHLGGTTQLNCMRKKRITRTRDIQVCHQANSLPSRRTHTNSNWNDFIIVEQINTRHFGYEPEGSQMRSLYYDNENIERTNIFVEHRRLSCFKCIWYVVYTMIFNSRYMRFGSSKQKRLSDLNEWQIEFTGECELHEYGNIKNHLNRAQWRCVWMLKLSPIKWRDATTQQHSLTPHN